MIEILLLVAGAAAMLGRPMNAPFWVGPAVAAAVAVAARVIDVDVAWQSLTPLRGPLLFLVFAVPLAVTLDRIGVFASIAAGIDGGRHLVAWLWILAAAVVIVFNLDAAVLLLTPLYIRIARRHGYPPEALAFQPALLACLASSPLPVSNLTNLIAAEQFELSVGQFVRHLGLPTLVACLVGYLGYRRFFQLTPVADPVDEPVDRRALALGLPIIGFVLIGFTLGESIGAPAWLVAAIGCAWAMAVSKTAPWRSIPWEAIVVAGALAVLVVAAVPHLGIEAIFDAETLERSGPLGRFRAAIFGVFGANAVNNLPAFLAGAGAVQRVDQVWPLLIGVNVGPVLVMSGSLSGLLWRDNAHAGGVSVSFRRYSEVGVKVGLPALVAAVATVCLIPL